MDLVSILDEDDSDKQYEKMTELSENIKLTNV